MYLALTPGQQYQHQLEIAAHWTYEASGRDSVAGLHENEHNMAWKGHIRCALDVQAELLRRAVADDLSVIPTLQDTMQEESSNEAATTSSKSE